MHLVSARVRLAIVSVATALLTTAASAASQSTATRDTTIRSRAITRVSRGALDARRALATGALDTVTAPVTIEPLPARTELRPSPVQLQPSRLRSVIGRARVGTSVPGDSLTRLLDTLSHMLDSSDFRARGAAVGRLATVPTDSIPSDIRSRLMTLLDREGVADARGETELTAQTPEVDAEEFGEYVIALTDLVLSFGDAHASRGVALIGIQTSRDAQQFVAAQGATVLPLLDSVYVANPATAPAVVKTWGYALATRPATPLVHADSVRLVNRLLTVAPQQPIAFASAARAAQFVDAAPALEKIGAETSDPNVARVTRSAAVQLRAIRSRQPSRLRVQQMGILLEGVCADPSADRARCSAVHDSLRVIRQAPSDADAERRIGSLSASVATSARLPAHKAIILQDASRDISVRQRIRVTTPP